MTVDRFSNREAAIAALVFAGAVAAVVAYALRFGLDQGYVWGGPAEWAAFGDYFGGVVNPFVGIATVVLVVWTLRTTRQEAADTRAQLAVQTTQMQRQVAHIEREQQLAELQKRLDGALAAWDALMAQELPSLARTLLGEGGNEKTSLRSILYRPNVEVRLMRLRDGPSGAAIKSNWDEHLNEAVNLLIEINIYCLDYDAASGSRLLGDFYRRRVDRPLRAMAALDLVPMNVVDGLRMGRFLGDIGRAVPPH